MGGTGTLILTNSTITKNSASTSGGGLYIGGGATAIITSGSVTENESSSSSAGQDVLVNSSSTTGTGLFEMGDSSVIGKIYLTSGCYITILSTLTGTTPVATITPASYSTSTQVLTLSTDSTTTLENEYEKFSVTSQEDGTSGSVEWSIDSNGYLSSSSGN